MTHPKPSASNSRPDDIKHRLLDLGMQNYITGRYAAFAGQVPVAGNLLHHAVEMFLKAGLATRLSLQELKDKFKHRLPDLWSAFLRDYPATADAGRFTAVIAALHRFEDLRYPETILEKGACLSIDPVGPPVMAPAAVADEMPSYRLVLDDVDALAREIFTQLSANPDFFTVGLLDLARQSLELHPRSRLLT